ncbi:MAG: DUF1971 domain-containing protein [Alphaproteobacteria bacterium]|nr:DUF1971 domain-containing protein [Alphaproteobacteria bacterium]
MPAPLALPADVRAYKRTRTFTEATVPRALTTDHDTRPGVWGRIVIASGALDYVVLEGPHTGRYPLDPDTPGVVAPTVRHRVELRGPVSFYVEFHR